MDTFTGGLKGPQPSAGARRKGAECPEVLVCYIMEILPLATQKTKSSTYNIQIQTKLAARNIILLT